MKKTKKLLLLLALICTLMVFGMMSASAATEGYYTYEVTDGAATIKEVDKTISGEVIIPDELGGYPVTVIGENAFEQCDNISEVVIPEGVTTIEANAFIWCDLLEKVIFPESLKTIGYNAFAGSTALKELEFRGIVESLPTPGSYEGAFYKCNITTITIPGDFPYISNLFGKNVEVINVTDGTLAYTLDSSDTSVRYYTHTYWYEAKNLKTVNLAPGVVVSSNAFRNCPSVKTVNIGNGTPVIWSYAFYDCNNLESVTIPESVTSISTHAFYSCEKLKEVIIPDSVVTLGDSAFCGCSGIEKLVVSNNITTAVSCVFSSCSGIKELTLPITFPFKENNFAGCTGVEDITITRGTGSLKIAFLTLTINGTSSGNTIYNYAQTPWNASQASELKVRISEGVSYLGQCIFYECNALTEISLPRSMHTISKYAFYNCKNLKSIDIPLGVNCASPSTFKECTALKNINVIRGTISEKSYQATDNTEDYYYGNLPWNRLPENNPVVNLEEGITYIPDYAFYGYNGFEEFALPDTVTSIGKYAFSNTNFSEIVIPDSINTLGAYAFSSCSNLETVTLSSSVTSSATNVFSSCSNLKTVHFEGTREQWESLNIKVSDKVIVRCYNGPMESHVHEYVNIVDDYNYANRCTQSWQQKHYCDCQEYKTVNKSPVGHTEVKDESVAPTCTETGLTEGTHCNVCNDVIIAQSVVEANGHTEVIQEAVEATCTQSGLTQGKYCSVCDEVLIAQKVVEASHKEVIDKALSPSCTETGLTQGKHCSACGEILVAQQTIDALGHRERTKSAVAPTCTKTGLTEGKYCSRCNKDLVAQQVVPVKAHRFNNYYSNYDATCTNDGTKTATCANGCGTRDTVTDTGSKKAHIDNNHDGKCDNGCGHDFTSGCGHLCHKGGIEGFFYKIALFFWKLFKTNKVCSCGIYHY